MKKLLLVLLLAAATAMPGCISRITDVSVQPVQADQETYVWSAAERHAGAKLALFPFTAPADSESVAQAATSAYHSLLLQRQPFHEIVLIEQPVNTDAEALWWARTTGCDLAMRPSVLCLLDGTGSTPTRLELRIRILDARSGRVLWDVKQTALSEPGFDVDLVWTTVPGGPAQRYPVLAQSLAGRFAAFLTQPPDGDKK